MRHTDTRSGADALFLLHTQLTAADDEVHVAVNPEDVLLVSVVKTISMKPVLDVYVRVLGIPDKLASLLPQSQVESVHCHTSTKS
jgi:hypothetical protein